MRRSFLYLAPLALLLALGLAACGNKGPLVYAPLPAAEEVDEADGSGRADEAGEGAESDPAGADQALPPVDGVPPAPLPADDDAA